MPKKVRNLRVRLLSVNRVDDNPERKSGGESKWPSRHGETTATTGTISGMALAWFQ
jgi:hypothetical protein